MKPKKRHWTWAGPYLPTSSLVCVGLLLVLQNFHRVFDQVKALEDQFSHQLQGGLVFEGNTMTWEEQGLGIPNLRSHLSSSRQNQKI